MYNHRTSKTIIIILSIIIVVAFIAYYFVYKNIQNKNNNYNAVSYDLSFQDIKQNYLTDTEKIINNSDISVKMINNSILPNGGEVQFIENLEAIAKDNAVTMTIDSLVVDDNSKNSSTTIETLRINAKTEGSWSGNYILLSRIETLPYKLKINRYDLINKMINTIATNKVPSVSHSVWQGEFEIDVLIYK